MCGITGSYQQADGQKLVDIMTDRIAHRGPDAAGIWSHQSDRVIMHLGHRRLSIIDLSAAANQPMSKDGLTLVYNGERYNFKALRAELKARGVEFTGDVSDRGYGLVIHFKMPGNFEVELYQPHYTRGA